MGTTGALSILHLPIMLGTCLKMRCVGSTTQFSLDLTVSTVSMVELSVWSSSEGSTRQYCKFRVLTSRKFIAPSAAQKTKSNYLTSYATRYVIDSPKLTPYTMKCTWRSVNSKAKKSNSSQSVLLCCH
jgi:hypothetical protein